MKKFWKRTEGFTLVELIVVIAILGILAGVGTVGYSGYVKKANMAADETLVRDMKNAAILAMYNNYAHNLSDSVVIKLSVDGQAEIVPNSGDDYEMVNSAMVAAFGEGWEDICKLKYTEWTAASSDAIAAYTGSSYYENIDSLMGKMEDLTGALTGFFDNSGGSNAPTTVKNHLEKYNVDVTNTTALTNGAVSALAETISNQSSEVRGQIADILGAPTEADAKSEALGDIYRTIYPDDANMVTLATAATIYAYAEAYSQFASDEGYDRPAEILGGIQYTNPDGTYKQGAEILGRIVSAFEQIETEAKAGGEGSQVAVKYNREGMSGKDAKAFLAVMDALNDSSAILNSNLTSSTFYNVDGTAANLIDSYIAAGSNLVEGQAAVIITPAKKVTAYLGGLIE